MADFVAFDFETADNNPDSACAIGLVSVSDNKIIKQEKFLIKPPRKAFVFTYIHGITWNDVCEKPTFKQLWPKIQETLDQADFIAAHNASFDKKVLNACCQSAKIERPDYEFMCTVQLARSVFGIYPTKLTDVCRELKITLDHHDPISDALACAKIVIAAKRYEQSEFGAPSPYAEF
ncbi:3'-5' exonuclease [Elusimicrobiota bacterium]